MSAIKTIDALIEAMKLNGLDTKESIEARFPELADALINNFGIQKGDKIFRFVETEFYHNLTDVEVINGKVKKITYKRETESCDFFFHNYGVDLAFESDGKRYGGVLIRAMKCGDEFINGPGRVADRLFDKFSAVRQPDDFPVLVPLKECDSIIPAIHKRWHIDGKHEYRYTWPKEKWVPAKKYDAYPWNE